MKDRDILVAVAAIVLFALLTGQQSYETLYDFSFTFEEDMDGWSTGFADLPQDHEPDLYETESGHGSLPSGIEGNGIYLKGHNRSDDLFMFLMRLIEGLKPETTYSIMFTVDLASNTPAGMMGIGGSPGESVYVKVGAVGTEPEIVEDSGGWLRMSLDKGNQASEGEDMINIGTISNPNIDLNTFTGEEYALMTLENHYYSFNVTSDSEGKIWVLLGTDSGFEGLTLVYYDSIEITLTENT